MKICMVGEGAFGKKHLTGLKNIDGVEVVSLVGGVAAATEAIAKEFGIPYWTLDLQDGLSQPGVKAARDRVWVNGNITGSVGNLVKKGLVSLPDIIYQITMQIQYNGH